MQVSWPRGPLLLAEQAVHHWYSQDAILIFPTSVRWHINSSSERPTELGAFRDYATAFPDSTTLLIDTYNTLEGARNACIVAKEMEARSTRLRAVRLDSGDLLTLSQQVRRILDVEGLGLRPNYRKP